ncbi:carboxymuconolactone decarboxylase family protein [Pedobacter antarcticus]|uniref:carboxymuconolactone decarboxylase family protein n=1 Tax=Pedobacter antarcticus TaxID=34086 RepID=UPI00292E8D53|nr:carboxymuconolactone decarboxylase family protein [Pedobacter antarcticus]
MANRINLQKLIPDAYQKLIQLDQYVSTSGVDQLQQELIKIRASQINGCAFCINMHIKDALKHGEDPKRIYVLSAWREAKKWFSNEDQLILMLTEEITLIANGGLSEETYNKALEAFGDETTAKLIMAVININAWNRLGVSLNMHPF